MLFIRLIADCHSVSILGAGDEGTEIESSGDASKAISSDDAGQRGADRPGNGMHVKLKINLPGCEGELTCLPAVWQGAHGGLW